MKKARKSHNMYPIRELMSETSAQALDMAQINVRKADPFQFRVIDGVLVTEREYQDWLERGGSVGSR